MASLLRLAILLLLIWLAWRLVRRWLAGTGSASLSKRNRPKAEPVARMVRCRHCDLHIPEREALHDGRDWYCSEAHQQADQRNRSD